MARPKKEGLDYFPLDVDIDQDDKVLIIQSKYGVEGFGILIKLLMEIYKNGYYYNWTEKEQLIFSSRVNVDINKVLNIVNDCIKWGFFHEDKYKEFQVLTSKGIQNRYLLAVTRRVDVNINDDLNLVNVDINYKLVEIMPEESTQSKRKEIKLNKTKINDAIYRQFKHLSITEKEVDKLISEGYEKELIDDILDRIENYKGNKNYVSLLSTARNWMKKDQSKNNKPKVRKVADF